MADVRIGINSEFNDAGFTAALQAIKQIQDALKKSGAAVEKSMKEADKSAARLEKSLGTTFKTKLSSRDVDGLTRALKESGKTVSQLSKNLSTYKTNSAAATKAQAAQIKALDQTRKSAALFNKTQLQGAKGADTLSKANKSLIKSQAEYDKAVRQNTRTRQEAEKGLKSYTTAKRQLDQLEAKNKSLGANAPEASKQRETELREYLKDADKMKQAYQATIDQTKETGRSLEQVRRNIAKNAQKSEVAKAFIQEQKQIQQAQEKADKAAVAAENKRKQTETRLQAQEEKQLKAFSQRIERLRSQAIQAQERGDAKEAAAKQKAAEKEIQDAEKYAQHIEKLRSQAYAKEQREQEQAAAKQLAFADRMEKQRSAAYAKEEAAEQKRAASQQQIRQQTFSNISTGALTGLTSATLAAANAMTKLAGAARTAAATLLNSLGRAASTVSNVLGRIGNTANVGLTKLRNGLLQTGKQALSFGKNMQQGMNAGNNALERSAAGWSLLMAGRTLSQTGKGILSGGSLGLDKYIDYEGYANRAAISGNTTIPMINELVTGMARGTFGGPAVRNLSLSDIAQGSYYLSSAIGLDITKQNMPDVAQMLNPLLQVAGYTMTSPETMIKGALNIAQEFGINPSQQDKGGGLVNSGLIGNIGATMGLLANKSTMEVPDIQEAFKMMGPMMNRVSGGSGLDNLADAMAWTYFASNAGLRGSSIGRSLDMFTSRLLDPTGPAMEAASAAFGIKPDENSWRNFFFDKNGDLKNGLGGALKKFIDLGETNPEMQDALIAQMFPQNAQRGLLSVMSGLGASNFDWDTFVDTIKIGKSTEAMDMLNRAIMQTNTTLGSASQNMQNAWQTMSNSIIESIKGPMIKAMDTFSNVLFELSDVFTDFPEIGQLFAGFAAASGIVLALVGSLLSLVGVILVLQRAFLFTNGAPTLFFTMLSGLPGLLLTAIPAILGIAAALVLLKTAWDANLFGVQDFVKFLQKGDISNWFASDFLPRMSGAIIALNKFKVAFTELIQGIFLGIGPTNNLGAFMQDFFGDFLGGALYGKLLQLQKAMVGVRASIRDFFSGMDAGGTLKNAMYSLQGFFELLFMGITSLRNMKSLDAFGDALGIDNFAEKVVNATDRMRGVITNLMDSLTPAFNSIKQSLSEIFDGDIMTGLGEFITGFAQGFGAAMVASIYAIGQGIAFVLNQIAQIGDYGSRLQGFIENLTGIRVEIDNIGQVAGAVFGGLLVGRILASFTPLAGIASILAGVGVGLVQLGLNAALAAVRIGLLAVAFAASAAASLLMAGPIGIITLALIVAGAAILGFIGYTQGLGAVFNTVGAAIGAFGDGLNIIADNMGTIIVAIAAAAATFAILGAAIFISANLVPIAIGAIALGIGALVVALTNLSGIDTNSWFDDFLSGLSELFSTLGNTSSIDEAEEVLTARINLFFADIAAAIANGAQSLVDKFQGSPLELVFNTLSPFGGTTLGMLGDYLVGGAVGATTANQVAAQQQWNSVQAKYNLDSNGAPAVQAQTVQQVVIQYGSGISTEGDYIRSVTGNVRVPEQGNNQWVPQSYPTSVGAYGNPQSIYGAGRPIIQYANSGLYGGQTSFTIPLSDKDLPWTKEVQPIVQGGIMSGQSTGSIIYDAMIAAMKSNGGQIPEALPSAVIQGSRGQIAPDYQTALMFAQAYQTQQIRGQQAGQGLANIPGLGLSAFDWAGIVSDRTPPIITVPKGTTNFGGPDRVNGAEYQVVRDSVASQTKAMSTTGYMAWDAETGTMVRTSVPVGSILDYGQGPQSTIAEPKPSRGAQTWMTVSNWLGKTGIGDSIDSMYEMMGIPKGTKPEELFSQLLGGRGGSLYDQALESLPPEVRDMLARYQRQEALGPKWSKIENAVKSPFGGGGLLSGEDVLDDVADAAAKEEERRQNMLAFNQQMTGTFMATDLPSALHNQFNGGVNVMKSGGFDMKTGAFPGYISGAQAMAMYGDAFTSGLPEGSTNNIMEALGDYVGYGKGEKNILGKNLKTAFGNDKGIQNWLAESGADWSAISAQLPQYAFDDQYLATAQGDLLGGISKMGPKVYEALDKGLNIDWNHLGQYATSQAQAGVKDWKLQDFIAEEYGVSMAEAAKMINDTSAKYGVDIGNSIGGELFSNTQMAVNSAMGTVNVIDDNTWKVLGDQLSKANDKILEVTQAQFDALDLGQKQALSNAGYIFDIQVDANVDTSAAEAKTAEAKARFEGYAAQVWDTAIQAAAQVDIVMNPKVAGFANAEGGITNTSPVNFDPSLLGNQGSMDWFQDYANNTGMISNGFAVDPINMPVPITPEYAVTDANGQSASSAIQDYFASNPLPPITVQQPLITALPFTGAGPLAGGGDGPALGSLNPFGGSDNSSLLAPMTVTITVTADSSQFAATMQSVLSILTTVGSTTATPIVTANTGAAMSALNQVLSLLRQVGGFNATPSVTVTGGAASTLSSILGQLQNISGFVATATVNIVTNGSVPSIAAGLTTATGAQNFAEGGYAKKGWAIVGEEGPELMMMSGGEFIHTASETQAMMRNNSSNLVTTASGGDTFIIEMNGPQYYNNEMDAKKVVDIVERGLGEKNRKANRGMVPASR